MKTLWFNYRNIYLPPFFTFTNGVQNFVDLIRYFAERAVGEVKRTGASCSFQNAIHAFFDMHFLDLYLVFDFSKQKERQEEASIYPLSGVH